MPYLGEEIPKLGFGLMRLPMAGHEVDLAQTCDMVDRFLAAGFTYFDTAYGYIGGKSEVTVKAALVDRHPRDRFQLATKLPAWDARSAEEARAMYRTSLERTGAGYFDYYLLHNLGDDRTRSFDAFGIWDFVQEQKQAGLIRHVGFSFHDKADRLDELLTLHPEMEFVQLQINYADWENHAIESRKCHEVAMRHGKPVIIMEPVKGGNLASLPPPAHEILAAADPQASEASWAIRFAASLPNVVTVLSGMSTLGQMDDNLSFMKDFHPLNDHERQVLVQVQEELAAIPTIPCTSCAYCAKDCPQSIPIHQIIKVMNRKLTFQDQNLAQSSYNWETRLGPKASDCIGCAACEHVCPQHIPIVDTMKSAAEQFEP